MTFESFWLTVWGASKRPWWFRMRSDERLWYKGLTFALRDILARERRMA